MTSVLFDEFRIKSMVLKNRFVRSATMEGMATINGLPTQSLKKLYLDLADGKTALIITGGAIIEPYKNFPMNLSFPLAMDENYKKDGWTEIIDEVHLKGTAIVMQLTYLGRQDVPEWRGSIPLAPSEVMVEKTGVIPKKMTKKDIDDVIGKFVSAALRVKEAGFDGVQFHGAHGNLINNFISPFTNRRNDEYGGSVENRARFAKELALRTKEAVGLDFPVLIKMNFNDYIEGGSNPYDAVKIAKIIANAGIDAIEVSGGTNSESFDKVAVKDIIERKEESYFRQYAEMLKKETDTPVILVGGNRSFDLIEEIIKENKADLISMSRPLICEPGLIKRWKNGNKKRSECVSCNQCFESWLFEPLRCHMKKL